MPAGGRGWPTGIAPSNTGMPSAATFHASDPRTTDITHTLEKFSCGATSPRENAPSALWYGCSARTTNHGRVRRRPGRGLRRSATHTSSTLAPPSRWLRLLAVPGLRPAETFEHRHRRDHRHSSHIDVSGVPGSDAAPLNANPPLPYKRATRSSHPPQPPVLPLSTSEPLRHGASARHSRRSPGGNGHPFLKHCSLAPT